MSTTHANSLPIGRIGLVFFGGLMCCNPYFLLLALPLVLGSVVSRWASRLDIWLKFLCTLLPLLLPLAVWSLLLSG